MRIPLLFTFPRESSVPRDKIYRETGFPLISCATRGEGREGEFARGSDRGTTDLLLEDSGLEDISGARWSVFLFGMYLKKNFQYSRWSVLSLEMVNPRVDLWIFRKYFESFLYFCATYVGCMQGGGIFDFTMMDYSIELFLLECFENNVLGEDNYCNYVIISIIFWFVYIIKLVMKKFID